MTDNVGNLFVVATPIGNLGDMVPRGLEVLQQANWIAAEDTRHSARLLAHFSINTPMISYHDYSGDTQTERLLALLEKGQSVALISDAGTPLISDPGYRLVRAARQKGIKVTPIPGPCAAIVALSAAGLPSDRFTFEGFLPAKEGARTKQLQTLVTETRTLVFYEAPHRVLATLKDMTKVLGADREIALARELTKSFETFLQGTLAELVDKVENDANQQRGEIVLIVRGAAPEQGTEHNTERRRVLSLLMADLPLKQAASLAAKITGGQRNALYQMALEIKNGED